MADVERVMRIRHGAEARSDRTTSTCSRRTPFLKLWDQISQGTFFALVVISSIALMVGGIGVMAIMSISVTERTREIGVRKALGARRAEILFQFLVEAAVLTSLGGLIGIALGAAIGWGVHLASRLPDLAALVVVRHRHRLLGLGRPLLRDVPGVQGLAARSDRSAAVRVAMMAGSIWLIAIVLLLVAHRRTRRRRGRIGAASAGAVYGWLNEDKRKAVEIVVEGRAEARDAEDRDGNLPDLAKPRR